MSYSRTLRRSFTVSGTTHGSVSVSYPASDSGGSMTVSTSLQYSEDVTVDFKVDVDTRPFDSSVASCCRDVDLLTGAVAATGVAHVKAKNESSQKIAGTIISGFFKTIKAELSQQTSNLTKELESETAALLDMKRALAAKQKQLESDYHRLAGQYGKTFADLDADMERQISELDRPAFDFARLADSQQARALERDLAGTVTVSGAECGGLLATVSASRAKRQVFAALGKIKDFLTRQRRLRDTISGRSFNESRATLHFAPVCYMESDDSGRLHAPATLSARCDDRALRGLAERFAGDSRWGAMPCERAAALRQHFNAELEKEYPGADARSARLRREISRLADFDTVSVLLPAAPEQTL